MNAEDEQEALAIRSLLDDYDATEALEWLSPLDDALEIPFTDVEAAQSTSGSDSAPSEASSVTGIVARHTQAGGHKKLPSSTASSHGKQADPNRARNERRLELIHLRRQAAELERHLGELRRHDPRKWSSFAIASDFQRSGNMSSLRIVDKLYPSLGSVPLWEELARDEKSKRVRVETENTRLRLLINSQVKTANQLRRILVPKRPRNARSYLSACFPEQDTALPLSDARTDHVVTTSSIPVATSFVTIQPSPPPFTRVSGLSSSQIFDMLKDRVICARRDMDALFMANGLATTEKAYRSAKVEQDDERGATMELVASKALPYDMKATRQVVWRHFVELYPKMPDRTSFQYHDERKNLELDGVDEMLAESYGIELGNGIVSAKFDEWRVLRQFMEPDRVIIIYCIVSEATEFVSKPVSGIRILKQIYIVLRRPSRHAGVGESGDSTTDSTLLQFYYRFQPVMYKTTSGLERTFAALTDFLFGFIGGRISINYQMIEQELRATAGYE